MDFHKNIESIKNRYGYRRYGELKISHFGDCRIYKAIKPYCSCGLVHDLMPLSFPEVIFPKFYEDMAISDGLDEEEYKQLKIDPGIKDTIKEVFGDPQDPGPYEIESLQGELNAISDVIEIDTSKVDMPKMFFLEARDPN